MRFTLIFAALALAACTTGETPTVAGRGADPAPAAAASSPFASPVAARTARTIANLPDHGRLVAYGGAEPVRRTAYTWYPASLSEGHALRAIATGTMEFETPEGTPVRLRYARHVEHPDGNWTWIGRPDGAQPGTEAIITFGEKAVFGSVPNGNGPPLRITTTNGRTWVMATDPRALRRMVAAGLTPQGDDFAVPPALAGARDKLLQQAAIAPQKLTASGAVPESATVDVAIGYTNAFASRLGGTSQAVTRLRYLVETANTAFTNSQIVGAIRLAGTVAVDYPDATSNGLALDALTGVTCTDTGCEEAPIPAALQPIHNLREDVGADLISLVRNFSDPENDSCGIAWLLGSGQDPITQDMAYAGASVVSDSNGNQFPDNDFICRDETFVHELAHNMGSAHDEATAQGDDGVTDAEDYGRYPYSFGYKTAVGNFYTIMAYRDEGQQPYRVFSNPRITYCGGLACGTANADNARSLGQTMPVVAQFLAAVGGSGPTRRSDFDGDGRSDVWWRNGSTGANVIFRSAVTGQTMTAAAVSWRVAGLGDFDGDGRVDVLWRNATTGQNAIWRSGSAATATAVLTIADQKWQIAGVGDFDANGRDDVLWRNSATGANTIWLSGNSSTTRAVATAPTAFAVAGVDDYNGDGIADILWRRSTDGVNVIWRSGLSTSVQAVTTAPVAWRVAGSGDFDGDGKADILWRNSQTGQNTIWRSGVSTTVRAVVSVALQWSVAAVADYDGNGQADILWRNTQTGQNTVWRSGLSTTTTAVPSVALAWSVVR